jgi:hypothetical protein
MELRAVADLASGWTVGSPESEEGQNRIITVRNDAVVVSVDYRKSISSASLLFKLCCAHITKGPRVSVPLCTQ